MKKPLTKEEFLDKRNSEVLQQVSNAINLQSELDCLMVWYDIQHKENPDKHLKCMSYNLPKSIKPKYHIHALFVTLIQDLIDGKLVYKKCK
jgi:hypothetical protein